MITRTEVFSQQTIWGVQGGINQYENMGWAVRLLELFRREDGSYDGVCVFERDQPE